MCLLLLAALAGLGTMLGACSSPSEPSASSVEQFESMLQEETDARWGGRVELVSGEVVLAEGESDMPPYGFEQHMYVATYEIAETGGRFVVAFPAEESPEHLRDWGLFASEMSDKEAAALGAYSERYDVPPIMLMRESGGAYGRDPNERVWVFTQIDYEGVYLMGEDVAMAETSEGEYEVVQEP
jgi:hypothetical protein